MTDRLEEAIAKVRKLPRERQDEAAELLLSVVEEGSDTFRLTPEADCEVERRLAEPSQYVPHGEVRASFK